MNYNNELSRFYEKDIIEFLESIRYKNNKNEKNVFGAMKEFLSEHDIKKADSLFEELINEYNEIPKEDVYKEILYNRISDIIDYSVKFLDSFGWDNSYGEIISKLINSKELEGMIPDIITVYESRKAEQAKEMVEKSEKDYKHKNYLDKKIQEINNIMFINIRKKDLKGSIKAYKLLKAYFEEYPSKFKSEKQNVYSDLLAHYVQIQKLKKELSRPNVKNHAEDFKRSDVVRKKYLKLEDVNAGINSIKQHVKKKEFKEAKAEIINLKHLVSKMPDDYKHLKQMLNSKINIINQRVEFAKNIVKKRMMRVGE